jgi:XRE family transcriptional regulator, regulator of sulfur utilization
MDAEWFAGRLRELREAVGLSRKELADKAGMRSEAGIRNLEQGIRKPSWETVLALCKALGVACDAFTHEPTDQPTGKAGRPRKTVVEEADPVEEDKPARKKRARKKRGQ